MDLDHINSVRKLVNATRSTVFMLCAYSSEWTSCRQGHVVIANCMCMYV